MTTLEHGTHRNVTTVLGSYTKISESQNLEIFLFRTGYHLTQVHDRQETLCKTVYKRQVIATHLRFT